MLYMPIACPGAGKTTIAKLMVEKGYLEPEAIVEPDYYRQVLTGDRANQKVNKAVFEIVDAIVDSRIAHGLDVYLDATNLNEKLRNKLLKRLNLTYDFVVPLTILYSDEPRWVVEERNANRPYPVPSHVFERFWDLSEALDVDPYVQAYGAKIMTFREMEELLS